MAAKRKRQVQSLLSKELVKTLKGAIQGDGTHLHEEFHLQVCRAVEILLHGKIKDASIQLYDRTPYVRVRIAAGGKQYLVHPSDPLMGIVSRIRGGGAVGAPIIGFKSSAILAVLPEDQLAMQMASIQSAAAEALRDPGKIGPVKERLRVRRLADKERLTARLRELFMENDGLLTEEEVTRIYRETVVIGPVMDS